jgi:hypothetical protein
MPEQEYLEDLKRERARVADLLKRVARKTPTAAEAATIRHLQRKLSELDAAIEAEQARGL